MLIFRLCTSPTYRGTALRPRHSCDIPVHNSRPIPAPTPHPALATAESLGYGQIHDDTPDEHTRAVRRTVVVARLSPRATSRHLINVDGKTRQIRARKKINLAGSFSFIGSTMRTRAR